MISRLIAHLRQHGLAATARKALAHAAGLLARAVYRNQVEILLELDLTAPMPPLPPNRLVVRDFVAEDAEEVRQFIREHNVDPDYGLQRFAFNVEHGYHAILGLLDEQIVAYGWWMGHGHTHPAQRLHGIQLGANEVYVCDLFVAPQCRKQGMALEFLLRSQVLGNARGYTRVVSTILETNRRSLFVHHQSGFKEFDRHRVHTFFNRVLLCEGRVAISDPLWF